MSIQIIEIRQFQGPATVELSGVGVPEIVEVRQGPAGTNGINGPNSVTSATTSDGTAELVVDTLSTTNFLDIGSGNIFFGDLLAYNYETELSSANHRAALGLDDMALLPNDGTATIDVLDATVQGTLTADHIHGNLAGSVYAHIRAGENLAKGDPVYISGSHGSGANLIAIVSKADAANAAKMPAVGVMDAAVANNTNGHMVITGTITELNTNAFAVNTVLYVATGGGWTSTPPAANSQAVAIVERSNTNNGAVIVKVNGLGSSGGNGAADANKLVRYDSAGSFAIPGPYETDSDAAYAGVPVDHLYYQPSGAVAANVDIPSLDLAFAVDKSLTARFGPTPTFTRGSTGTFVGSNGLIQSAAIDTPRFDHDPVTGICRGLLIEEQRQNLISFSESIANAAWSSFANATATDNQATSPSGVAASASRLTAIAGTSTVRGRNRILSITTGGTSYSTSAFIRAGTSNFGFVSMSFNRVGVGGIRDCIASIVLSTGVVTKTGTSNADFTVTSTAYPDGWYKITVSATSNASAVTENQVVLSLGLSFNGVGGSGTFTGTETVFGWGAQLEVGAFATSYIPTTTTALTRSADVCSITGANFTSFYNQSEGTVVINASTPASGDRTIIGIDDNTANEMIRLRTEGTDPFYKVTDGGSDLVSLDLGAIVARTAFKVAACYKLDDFAASLNGAAVGTDNTGTIPTVDRLRIGQGQSGNIVTGHIARFQYFRKRLPNAKLQSLTT